MRREREKEKNESKREKEFKRKYLERIDDESKKKFFQKNGRLLIDARC